MFSYHIFSIQLKYGFLYKYIKDFLCSIFSTKGFLH